MLPNESDASLVSIAQNGDRNAFAVLFLRHQAVLRALCRRTLADSTLADDIVQEAALQAMLNLDRLRDKDRFGPWLCGIGLNLCRRSLRERSRPLRANWSWEVVCGGHWIPEPAASGVDPQDLAEEADLAARVRRAVADLPRGQHAAVLLFYLSGLTYDETAAQLGIDVGAVKTRLHKARRALRRQLESFWKETTMDVTTQKNQPVPVRLVNVRRRAAEGDKPAQFILILEEIDGERRLPIWVGKSEGVTAALQLERRQWPRPQTYAFTANLLQAVGGRLREVIITKLDEAEVFYAEAIVESARKKGTVDARPSDAINLALMTGAHIRVDPSVFAAAEAQQAPQPPHPDPFGEGYEDAKAIVADVEAHWIGPGSLTSQAP